MQIQQEAKREQTDQKMLKGHSMGVPNAQGTTALLEVTHLGRMFRSQFGLLGEEREVWAVRDVSFAIHEGETLGLVGESGCGKSTVAKLITGLLAPSRGIIKWNTSIFAKNTPLLRKVQMVFQDPFSSLNPRMKIGTSVAEPLVLAHKAEGKRADRAQIKQEAVEMLEKVGLQAEHYARYPHEFSGGQRQRVAIARALITKPRLLICDEPVSALDVSVQAQVLNLLKDMQAEYAMGMLFISHDIGVVSYMSENTAVMYKGEIVEQGNTENLLETPTHPYTKKLLASVPAVF